MALIARLLVLAALIVNAAPAVAKSDLIIGMRQFPSNFHPLFERSVSKSYVLAATNRSVTAFDADWKPVCILCVSLPQLETDAPDGANAREGRVRLTLQPDAFWGDGVPVTTKDLLFTWRVGRHPDSGVASSELFRRIAAIDVVDDKTAILRFDRLTFDITNLNELTLLPAHLESNAFTANPRDYRNRSLYMREPTNPGLYLGPYVVSEIASGTQVVLTRNRSWKGRPPAFDKVVIKTIEDTAALVANLLSGEIDMIAGEAGIAVDQAAALERYGERFHILYRLGLNFEHIDLNLDNDILRDVRVRRALLFAVDRDQIVQSLFGGRYQVAHSPVSPLDRIYASTIPKITYDPGQARHLLDEAGWHSSGDGMRRNAAGQPLRLEILTTAGNHTRDSVLQVLQDEWRHSGIDVRIRSVPARTLFGSDLPRRKFTGMVLYAYIVSPERVPRLTLHSEQIPSAGNNWSGFNFSGYRDPEMDGLIEAIEGEMDFHKRLNLWRKYQLRFAEQMPILPLYFYSLAYVLPPWLKGLEPTGHDSYTPLWIENWYDSRAVH